MKPLEIKANLVLKGITLTEIAKELGVSVSIISQVIHNRAISKRVRKAISKKLEIPVSEIWKLQKQSYLIKS